MKKAVNTPKWLQHATLEDALPSGLTETEFKHIIDVLGRPINNLEMGICSALFSEHCSYKSTKVHLRGLPTEGKRVIQGPGENAGVVDIGDGEAVVFKVESHNHPTFIEPYQGAATGVGGILRDVFTMGARPLALMNALRFGVPDNERTSYLLSRAVKGIGGYGNCMGVPTVGGETSFHESYNGNCLVNAFALGLVRHESIFLGKAAGIGNSIIYVGSKTGRDGIHGATMSSAEFDDNSAEKRPTVQVGDPFQEKLLLEACLEAMASGAVIGIQDMGAAGMTSSTYEMADRAQTGVVMHLDRVPQREEGMNPYEIMLSESQERMLLVAEKGREQELLDIFAHWELDAVIIGEVVPGRNVDLFWNGENVSSIPVEVLTSAVPQYRWPEEIPSDYNDKINFAVEQIDEVDNPQELSKIWMRLLSSVDLCSRKNLFSQYDSTVRSNTVIHPGGDAALIRIKRTDGKPEKGVAMTLDCNSRFCGIEPRLGAALTVAEAIRNITAVGAEPIGISDCLNFGSPHKPQTMWQIAEGIRGLGDAARAFSVPIVSGNVSLNNETKGKAILPTPMIAMVGLMEDASKATTIHFKHDNDAVLVIGATDGEDLGGSEYFAQIAGVEKGALPVLDYDTELATSKFIRSCIQDELLSSCHDISGGGLAIALAESCFGPQKQFGVSLNVESYEGRKDGLLFAETGARYLVSCNPKHLDAVKKRCEQAGIEITASGSVTKNLAIDVKEYATIDGADAIKRWEQGLDALLG
jgi:phosphoribosylformylglycinamidine synthase II